MNGTATATNIAIAKLIIDCGCIERIPGRPPTPIELAVLAVATEMIAAAAEPIIAQINGKLCFKFTPNIAGSVTPK